MLAGGAALGGAVGGGLSYYANKRREKTLTALADSIKGGMSLREKLPWMGKSKKTAVKRLLEVAKKKYPTGKAIAAGAILGGLVGAVKAHGLASDIRTAHAAQQHVKTAAMDLSGVVNAAKIGVQALGRGTTSLVRRFAPKAAAVLETPVAQLRHNAISEAVSKMGKSTAEQAGHKLPVWGQ